MPSGGARNRSGPAANENSERSDRRGFKLTALPAEGYDGDAPAWPLEPAANATERSYWERAWRTPQACAWSMPSESWRIPTVARWVRLSVRCDAPDAGAAHLGQLHRFADQIGMTTAGLAEMGWKVTVDELSERRDEPATPPTVEDDEMTARRKRAISGGA
ncbi:MAG: hypothetical protein IPM08_03350 [Actinomycetales bacterium]|nr:hypothetical protein [Actinomycetales bacterium]